MNVIMLPDVVRFDAYFNVRIVSHLKLELMFILIPLILSVGLNMLHMLIKYCLILWCKYDNKTGL